MQALSDGGQHGAALVLQGRARRHSVRGYRCPVCHGMHEARRAQIVRAATGSALLQQSRRREFGKIMRRGDLRHVAQPIFREVFRAEPAWAVLIQRLPRVDLLSDDPALMRRILAALPG